MQQTQKYKLNLIESSDPFSPEGLNQNTQKIENAMIAHEAAVEEKIAAVVSRVVDLEKFHYAAGMYHGNGADTQTIELGFTPTAVLVRAHTDERIFLAVPEYTFRDYLVKIVPGGFTVGNSGAASYNNGYYTFMAFGIDE